MAGMSCGRVANAPEQVQTLSIAAARLHRVACWLTCGFGCLLLMHLLFQLLAGMSCGHVANAPERCFTATDLVVKAGMACERVANAPEQLNALGWGAFVTRALTSARVTNARQQTIDRTSYSAIFFARTEL